MKKSLVMTTAFGVLLAIANLAGSASAADTKQAPANEPMAISSPATAIFPVPAKEAARAKQARGNGPMATSSPATGAFPVLPKEAARTKRTSANEPMAISSPAVPGLPVPAKEAARAKQVLTSGAGPLDADAIRAKELTHTPASK